MSKDPGKPVKSIIMCEVDERVRDRIVEVYGPEILARRHRDSLSILHGEVVTSIYLQVLEDQRAPYPAATDG